MPQHLPPPKPRAPRVPSPLALRALPLVLSLWVGCAQAPTEQAPPAQAVAVQVGVPARSSLRAEAPGQQAALEAWRAGRTEESALALARALFPEFGPEASGAREALPAEVALRVELASRESGAMRLATRGHVFGVRPLEGGSTPVSRSGAGATFYGPRHFFTLLGQPGAQPTDAAGAALASRVEEFEVLDAGQASWRAAYEVALPAGVTAVRDARDYLEFLDAGGTPVLRMHYPLARDSAGAGRQGTVRLEGVRAGARAASEDGLAVYALAGGTLRVEMALELSGLEGPVVVDPGWSATAVLAQPRSHHGSTLLGNGRVLVTGGLGAEGTALASAEVYDVDSNTWRATAPLAGARARHSASLLPGGRVLVAGGLEGTTPLASAELYDVATGTWSPTGALTVARRLHTANLLPDGRLLVAGGLGAGEAALSSAELYDFNTGLWSATGALAQARAWHTATLLPGGRVLVAGGTGAEPLSSAELYEAASGTWSAAAPLGRAHSHHSATRLFDGRVLVAGGQDSSGALAAAWFYDVTTNAWSEAPALPEARARHSATLLPGGQVVVAGGRNATGVLGTTQVYDVATGTWSAGGALASAVEGHSATLLPTGKVLLAGGKDGVGAPSAQALAYDAELLRVQAVGSMGSVRISHSLTPLADGRVLAAGGYASSSTSLASAELYDPATRTWSATGSLLKARWGHSATLLPDGRVLVAGGNIEGVVAADAELYDPATGTWSATGPLLSERIGHSATLLPNGKVLVVGGNNAAGTAFNTAELYDAASGTFSAAPSMIQSTRTLHSAVLLPGGQVLVVGGSNNDKNDTSTSFSIGAELYDPVTNSWRGTSSLTGTGRRLASLTVLPNGKVLIAGGLNRGYINGSELYDPGTGTWTATGSLELSRCAHTATLLPNGKVLVTGGRTGAFESRSSRAEVYDPATGLWRATVPMVEGRELHDAVLLPEGRVLVAGGNSDRGGLAGALLYEEPRGLETWSPTVSAPEVLGQGRFGVSGSGFLGLSEAGQGSAANVPLATLRSLEGDSFRRLAVTGFSATSLQLNVPALPEGHYVLSVSTQGVHGGRIVRVDRTPPARPTVAVPLPGAILTTQTPTFSGSTEPHASVTLYVDGQAVAQARADGTGAWSATLTQPLAEGQRLLSVSATDGANNTSPPSVEVAFSVDSALPAAPVVQVPANGASFNSRRPVFSGIAEAGGTVTLTLDGAELGTAVPNSTWNWSFQAPADLADGTYTLTTRITDVGGNTSAPSESVTFRVDTQAPAAPVVTAPTAGQALRQVRPTFRGTAEPGSLVTVLVDNAPAGQATTNLAGSWSLAAPADLSNDNHTVGATARDAAGNASTPSASVSFAVDTLAPEAPVLLSPAEGATLALTRPTFSGGAEPLSTVTLLVDGTPVGTVSADASGAFSLTLAEPLSEGTRTVSATATDAAGNASAASAGRALTLDSIPPAPPTLTSPSANGAWFSSTLPGFSGSAEAGSLVALFIDGAAAGTVRADGTGAWSLQASAALGDGPHTVRASATDAAGNTSATSASLAFGLDTLAPEAPVLLAPTSGARLNAPRPLLSGTAEAGSTVSVSVDGVAAGTTVANGTGAWSLLPAADLAEGTRTVRATATDAAGNTGPALQSSFSVDRTLPAVPVLRVPAPGSSLGSTQPTLSGTAEAGSTVTLLLDDAVLGTVVAEGTGAWSFTPAQPLPEGLHTLRVTATSPAGNTRTGEALSFTVDTTAPVAPGVDSPARDALLGTRAPTLGGTAEAGSTVTVSVDGVAVGSAVASASGAWSLTLPTSLEDGAHTLSVTARDAAGNSSAASAAQGFTVDATAPQAPVVQAPAAGATVDTARPTFSGTAEAGSTLTLWVDDAQVGTVAVGASGQWSFTLTTELAQGTHTAKASATDAAGNTSATSAVSLSVALPAAPPAPSVDEAGGCGCASTSGGGGWLWGLLLLGLWSPLRRRRP